MKPTYHRLIIWYIIRIIWLQYTTVDLREVHRGRFFEQSIFLFFAAVHADIQVHNLWHNIHYNNDRELRIIMKHVCVPAAGQQIPRFNIWPFITVFAEISRPYNITFQDDLLCTFFEYTFTHCVLIKIFTIDKYIALIKYIHHNGHCPTSQWPLKIILFIYFSKFTILFQIISGCFWKKLYFVFKFYQWI